MESIYPSILFTLWVFDKHLVLIKLKTNTNIMLFLKCKTALNEATVHNYSKIQKIQRNSNNYITNRSHFWRSSHVSPCKYIRQKQRNNNKSICCTLTSASKDHIHFLRPITIMHIVFNCLTCYLYFWLHTIWSIMHTEYTTSLATIIDRSFEKIRVITFYLCSKCECQLCKYIWIFKSFFFSL